MRGAKREFTYAFVEGKRGESPLKGRREESFSL